MNISPKVRITPRYTRSSNRKKIRKLNPRPSASLHQKLPIFNPLVKNQETIRPHSNFATTRKKNSARTNHFSNVSFRINQISKNTTSKFLSITSIFFQIIIFFIKDTFKQFLFLFVIFCSFFIIFYSLHKTYLKFAKISDHLLKYDISTTT